MCYFEGKWSCHQPFGREPTTLPASTTSERKCMTGSVASPVAWPLAYEAGLRRLGKI